MSVQRRIGRVLVAARGHAAAERVAAYEAFGIETVVVFDASDADDAHLEEASWAAALPEGAPLLAALVGVAMDAGADAFDPSGTELAASEEASRLATSVGLAWLGARAELLAGESSPLPAAPLAFVAPSVEVVAVTVLGDGEGGLVVVGTARVRKDVALVGDLEPGLEAALLAKVSSAASALRVHGAATAWLRVGDDGDADIFGWSHGLPEHHALLTVGGLSLAAAAVRLHAGENLGLSSGRLAQVPCVRAVVRARVDGQVPALEAAWSRAEGTVCAPGDVLAVVRVDGPTPPAACVRAVAALHALAEPALHDARVCADALAPWSASGAQRATLGQT